MKDSGQSNRKIAKHIGCNQSTVSKVCKQWKEEKTIEVQKRSGRPRKTNEKMDNEQKRLFQMCQPHQVLLAQPLWLVFVIQNSQAEA